MDTAWVCTDSCEPVSHPSTHDCSAACTAWWHGLSRTQYLSSLPSEKTNIPPTLIEFPSDTKVAAGQAVSLNCTFSTSSGYHYLHWYKDGKDIPLILENPNCQELNDSVCRTDVRYPDDHSIRMSNVRSYMYSQQFCLQDSVHRHAHLVIDRAELGDAGKYTCKLFNISSDEPLQSVTVTLQVGESTWRCHGKVLPPRLTPW